MVVTQLIQIVFWENDVISDCWFIVLLGLEDNSYAN